jgi:hypothetical protein
MLLQFSPLSLVILVFEGPLFVVCWHPNEDRSLTFSEEFSVFTLDGGDNKHPLYLDVHMEG